MARAPAAHQVQVNFRMPAALKARIEAAAEANSRSTTAEIVSRLETSFGNLGGKDGTVSFNDDELRRFVSVVLEARNAESNPVDQ